MSYDLYLLRPEPGHTVAEAAERVLSEADSEVSHPSADPKAMAQIAQWTSVIRTAAPSMQPFQLDFAQIALAMSCTEDEARLRNSHVELNESPEPGLGVQVTVHSDHVFLSLPYWHAGQPAQAAFALIRRICEPLLSSGFVLFDPQDDRAPVLPDEWPNLIQEYEAVVRQVKSQFSDQPKPWWKFWKR